MISTETRISPGMKWDSFGLRSSMRRGPPPGLSASPASIVAHLFSRNIKIEEDLVDQLFNSSEKRLARVLLLLANFGKEGKPEPVIPKISQETLASIVGTTRSRINSFMNRFRKLGFIEYNGGLEVHSSLLNVVLHD